MTYTRLPARRPRSRSGIERAPQREWPRHRRFVRSHGCCVPGCPTTPVDFHHLKTRGSGGGDETGVSLCRIHHIEIDPLGTARFDAKYNINLWALAAEFVRLSPDVAMKEALGLIPPKRKLQ